MKEEKNYFEPRFGEDFSEVRIHNDSQAHELSEELNAQVFQSGADIYYNSNEYDTGSTEGKRLMAHELAPFMQCGVGNSCKFF